MKGNKTQMDLMYVRVSTKEQNEERQIKTAMNLGITEENIFIDKQSGKTAEREQLKELIKFSRRGDTIFTDSISRIARNTKDLLNIVEVLKNKGVEFVSLKESIDTILKSFDSDFIIQKIVKQSAETALFNPSSLNTMRISTLFLNGEFTICTAMIKFGQPNKIVDNIGSGGCCVGINDDGTLMNHGFNHQYDKIDSWNGIPFKGHKITNFENVIETARKAHLCIPQCKFVGWDFAIDENGNVLLIEANLIWPGLFFAQMANGKPALRGRENEVLEYVSSQPFPFGSAT